MMLRNQNWPVKIYKESFWLQIFAFYHHSSIFLFISLIWENPLLIFIHSNFVFFSHYLWNNFLRYFTLPELISFVLFGILISHFCLLFSHNFHCLLCFNLAYFLLKIPIMASSSDSTVPRQKCSWSETYLIVVAPWVVGQQGGWQRRAQARVRVRVHDQPSTTTSQRSMLNYVYCKVTK